MAPRSSPDRASGRYSDSPIAWFGELFLAKARGDFRRAALAQEQLSRLGWAVRFKPSRRAKGGDR